MSSSRRWSLSPSCGRMIPHKIDCATVRFMVTYTFLKLVASASLLCRSCATSHKPMCRWQSASAQQSASQSEWGVSSNTKTRVSAHQTRSTGPRTHYHILRHARSLNASPALACRKGRGPPAATQPAGPVLATGESPELKK